jgi:hypothetical protein
MKTIVVLLCLFSTTAQAEVKYLKAGELAPFEGILFDMESEKKLRLLDVDLKACGARVELLESANNFQAKLANDYENSANLYRMQSEQTAQLALEATGNTFWRNALYFAMGVLLAGLTVSAVK